MDLNPPNSTQPPERRPDFYLAYLNSSGWRTRRNAALKDAKYRCSACGSGRNLQVHHLTYERLGAELDEDLRVVCGDCHQQTHIAEMEESDGKVYLKIARQALNDDPFARISDLAEDVKTRCAKLKIRYEAHQVDKALGLLCGASTRGTPPPQTRVEVEAEQGRDLSPAEAREFLARFGWGRIIKSFPRVELYTQRELDRMQALEMVAREIQASLERGADLEAGK